MRNYSSTPPEVRFWSHVHKTDTCWLWTGAVMWNGYGVFCPVGSKVVSTHRYVWIITHGAIPDGLHVCHTCDVRHCVNPAHLFLGTRKDNMQDAVAKDRMSRTHNPKGKNAGETHGLAKLTEEMAREIKRRRAAGERNKDIAVSLGVSEATVSSVYHGKRWGHL